MISLPGVELGSMAIKRSCVIKCLYNICLARSNIMGLDCGLKYPGKSDLIHPFHPEPTS